MSNNLFAETVNAFRTVRMVVNGYVDEFITTMPEEHIIEAWGGVASRIEIGPYTDPTFGEY